MTKKPKPDPDKPGPSKPEDRLIDALKDLLPERNPVMVTGWIAIVEYIDQNGDPDLGAFASNMPPWRMNGIFDTGREMLVEEFEYDDYEE